MSTYVFFWSTLKDLYLICNSRQLHSCMARLTLMTHPLYHHHNISMTPPHNTNNTVVKWSCHLSCCLRDQNWSPPGHLTELSLLTSLPGKLACIIVLASFPGSHSQALIPRLSFPGSHSQGSHSQAFIPKALIPRLSFPGSHSQVLIPRFLCFSPSYMRARE